MRLIYRLRSAIDVILGAWPYAMGGHYLRYFLWKNRFAYCGGGYALVTDLWLPAFRQYALAKERRS